MAIRMPKFVQSNRAMREEAGSMTIFIAVMFTTMIGVAGIAVDIARFEAGRTELQAHLDNCTLSAASLRQTEAPSVVLDACMAAAKLDGKYTIKTSNEVDTITYRRLDATGEMNMNTMFMKIFGVDDLGLAVSAAAEERVPFVEVSLVLDVSGSMKGSRLEKLIPAAQDFVDDLLLANDEENPNRVSISLIPYNSQVSAGKRLLSMVYGGYTPLHDNSYCVGWDAASFSDTGFSSFQMTQFTHSGYQNVGTNWNNHLVGYLDQPYCRTNPNGQILPFSNNAAALKAQIGALKAFGPTSIDIGVKWGAALLDPSAQAVLAQLASPYQVDPQTGQFVVDPQTGTPVVVEDQTQSVDMGFIGRPVAYDDEETLKALVVMTDGENTTEYHIKNKYRGNGGSGVYYKASDDKYSFSYQWGSSWKQLSWDDMWAKVPVYTYAQHKGGGWWSYQTYNIGNWEKNNRLSSICNAAKAKGVKIFGIAYSATGNGKAALENCATDSFYYDASETSISDTFDEIGGVIEKLKLVQ